MRTCRLAGTRARGRAETGEPGSAASPAAARTARWGGARPPEGRASIVVVAIACCSPGGCRGPLAMSWRRAASNGKQHIVVLGEVYNYSCEPDPTHEAHLCLPQDLLHMFCFCYGLRVQLSGRP
eukprot:XP_006529920.1 PREDICTED: glutaredoxin-2, mitochondrial isoform X3 [Mus musculus]